MPFCLKFAGKEGVNASPISKNKIPNANDFLISRIPPYYKII